MSVLGDFVRMRFYRKRAEEYERLAETAPTSNDVRARYREIARHYRQMLEFEQRADKSKVGQRLEILKAMRGQPHR